MGKQLLISTIIEDVELEVRTESYQTISKNRFCFRIRKSSFLNLDEQSFFSLIVEIICVAFDIAANLFEDMNRYSFNASV